MISPVEFENFLSAGRRASETESAHRRFGAGVDKTQHLDRRHRGDDHLRELDFADGWRAERKSARGRLLHRLDHIAMSVAEDHGTPGAYAVDVLEIVGVENPRALPLLDE